MARLKLSFRKKIILAVLLSVAGFAVLGAVVIPALRGLVATVGRAQALNHAAMTVAETHLLVLTLNDESRRLAEAGAQPFLSRLDDLEGRREEALAEAGNVVGNPELTQQLEDVGYALSIYLGGLRDWVSKRGQLGFDARGGRWAAARSAGDDLEKGIELFSALRNQLLRARDHERSFLLFREPAELSRFREAAAELKEKMEETGLGALQSAQGKTNLSLYFDYVGAVESVASVATEMWSLDDQLAQALDSVKAKSGEVEERVAQTLAEAQAGALRAGRRASASVIGGGVAVAGLLVGLLAWIGGATLRSLHRTSALLKDMAMGDGDLTQRLPQTYPVCSALWDCPHRDCPSHGEAGPCWSQVGTHQLTAGATRCHQLRSGEVADCDSCRVYGAARTMEVDEFDRLAHWFNTFVDKIRNLVAQTKEVSGRMASASEQLSSSTSRIASSSEQASSQSHAVATAAEEMNATVQSMAKNTSEVSLAANEARRTASDGARVVSQAADAMGEIASVVEQAAATVRALGQQAEKIGAVVEVIEDIADQTNLLALNAAIEAARAGEQGRGFSVVADEVRKLAEKTVRATHEIAQTVAAIQQESRRAVGAIDHGTGRVAAGRALGEEAGDAIHGIEVQVSQASEQTSQIATATEELAATIRDMAVNMEQIARGVEDNAAAAAGLAQTASAVAMHAEDLHGLTARFRT